MKLEDMVLISVDDHLIEPPDFVADHLHVLGEIEVAMNPIWRAVAILGAVAWWYTGTYGPTDH